MDDIYSLLKKLVEAHGPPGCEDEVRSVIIDELQNFVDEISVDSLGNIISKKSGTAKSPKIMLCAHMDEVGLFVKHISDEGFIFFEKYGWIDDRILPAQWVIIHSKKGPVRGVIGIKAKHLLTPEDLTKPLSFRDMWIDIGARNKIDVEEMGVRVGDPITFDRNLQELGKGFIVGRALDNRLGCAILIQSMKELAKLEHEATVFGVASVLEEVGARGAKTAAYKINPDIAIALDTTFGIDPAVTPKLSAIELGKGPAIRLMDIYEPNLQGCLTPFWIKELVFEIAKEEGIPYQIDISSYTFLDSSTIHTVGEGIPSFGILTPRRNAHAPAEVAHLDDVKNAIRLVIAIIKRLNEEVISRHKYKKLK
jgi:endoglucanase